MLSAIWITGHSGFQSTMQYERKSTATLTKMSMTNVENKSSEGCMLLGEEGGMTNNERVEDKEIDGAQQKTES